ncbi:MAG: tetratricopeptide repeat protein [Alphaproteobacteria bacterium]
MRFILFISVVLFMNAAAFAQTDPTPKIAPGSDADLQSTCAGNVSMRTVKNGTWTKPTVAQLLVMANGQDVDAMNDLCTCYHTREDYEESLYWCKSASAKGDVGAQNMVAYMLRMGQGTPADPRAAFALYQQAAKNSLE